MIRKKKTTYDLEFTENDLKIIHELVITLALVFENILENVNVRSILKESSKMTSSMQYSTFVAHTLQLIFLYHEQGRFPEEIKNEIVKVLMKKHHEVFLHNQTVMSKVFKLSENHGITLKIKDKKNIKAQSPKSIPRKPKVGRPRRVGRYIVLKLTSPAEDYRRVLSNPQALALINKRLLEFGLLKKAYDTIVRNAFAAFRIGGDNFYDTLKMFHVLFQKIDNASSPNPKLFQEQINLLSESEIEGLRQMVVSYLVENPSFPVFFIFSLHKLANYGKS